MSTTIYLLFGASGLYSDHSEWNLKAFTRKEGAEALKSTLEAKEVEIRRLRSDREYDAALAAEKALAAFDPKRGEQWEDVSYAIEEIQLEGGEA